MNQITDVWRQLVRRRLWPVALLLVAALAAVPMLLAEEPEPAPPAPLPAQGGTAKAELASEPIVALGEPIAPGTDRTPLGDRHDIFKPTKKPPKVKAAKQEEAPKGGGSEDPPATGGEDKGSSGSGGGTTTPSTPPAPPTPATPAPKPETYPLYSLKVRFSAGDGSEKGYLPRLSALPSRSNPMLVYLGLLEDRKTAVFLLDSTLQAIGDGECHPTPENCETVRMRVGDTMFFDVIGEDGEPAGDQYQLDLLGINKKQTKDAAKAAKSARLAKVAAAVAAGGDVTTGLGRNSLRRLGVVGRTG